MSETNLPAAETASRSAETAPKPRASGWIPELDGLRVIMIFIVSAYHIWQQSWLTPSFFGGNDALLRSGYVWVDGTVLLSAFLLFLPYVKKHRAGEPLPDPKDFYFRRAKRILPAYYTIILLTLFIICIPFGLYYSPQFLVKDVATHLTFTFPFFYDTYIATPLGAASWTLAIEVQAYLLFPWIARAALKKPGRTFGIMLFLSWGFRLWCLWSLTEYNMVVNQLINFLDVYAIGMGLAWLHAAMTDRQREKQPAKKAALLWQVAATVVFALAARGLWRLLVTQARSGLWREALGIPGWITAMLNNQNAPNDYCVIQRNQMVYRPFFAVCFAALIFAAPRLPKCFRILLGNPVTKFLSGVSMNYYLIHQTVIVHMKRVGFPSSVSETPNLVGEQPWQTQYTLLAFGISLLLAILVTYAVEKPAARLIDKYRQKKTGG